MLFKISAKKSWHLVQTKVNYSRLENLWTGEWHESFSLPRSSGRSGHPTHRRLWRQWSAADGGWHYTTYHHTYRHTYRHRSARLPADKHWRDGSHHLHSATATRQDSLASGVRLVWWATSFHQSCGSTALLKRRAAFLFYQTPNPVPGTGLVCLVSLREGRNDRRSNLIELPQTCRASSRGKTMRLLRYARNDRYLTSPLLLQLDLHRLFYLLV
jgi:hypothetical protein